MIAQLIVESLNSKAKIWGYKRSYLKTFFMWIIYILSGFIIRLILEWLPRYRLYLEFTECGIVPFMDKVLCQDSDDVYWIHNVYCTKSTKSSTVNGLETDNSPVFKQIIFFQHKKLKYIWNWSNSSFERLIGLEDTPLSEVLRKRPLSNTEVQEQNELYGNNEIRVKVTPICRLLLKEGLNPFYVFQIGSCMLWFADEYYIYASCIVFMSAISLVTQLYMTRKNERALRDTVTKSGEITVIRREQSDSMFNKRHVIDSSELVPGDMVELPLTGGCIIPCDLVLLRGTGIVNESMLTGESAPVTKTSLPLYKGGGGSVDGAGDDSVVKLKLDSGGGATSHARHILYCGTKLIQGRRSHGDTGGNNRDTEDNGNSLIALVVRTGYLTAKGGLVRSILFPGPLDKRFNRDAIRFVLVLAGFAIIGMIYTFIIMIRSGISWEKIIIRSLDLITIVVPPALPVSMTIGVMFAQSRLKESGIFCISPQAINMAGGIDVACFDKTGTLTEDGLDLLGVLSSSEDGTLDQEPHRNPKDDLPLTSSLLDCMAACHTLTVIDGELCGDPLDLKMFQATGWKLREGGASPSHNPAIGDADIDADTGVGVGSTEDGSSDMINKEKNKMVDMSVPLLVYRDVPPPRREIGVLRQLPFSSALQRMSVVVKIPDRPHFTVFVKGSPEMIASICRRDTIPREFERRLVALTREGYRVLALAYRPLRASLPKVMRAPRQRLETELRFLGLLIMENRLKSDTDSVIIDLHAALIRTVMVTGDNMLTALSVARDCEMVAEEDRVVLLDARLDDDGKPQVELHYAEDLQRTKMVSEVLLHTDQTGKEYENGVKICVLDHSDFHLALTGRSWSVVKQYCPNLLPRIVVKGTVFARFSPEQKAQLVVALQNVGYIVAMVGDGANDCGALRAAHAGISLSAVGGEASVASPFTSAVSDISCLPILIKEGRCALATSYGMFRYMAGYSFTQFISVLLLYWFVANLGDLQFLYIDLILLTTFSVTYGYTRASNKLSPQRPSICLLSVPMVGSLVCHWLINGVFQMGAHLTVNSQPWYFMPHVANHSDTPIHLSYTNTAVFLVSAFQYIILVVVFSKSAPFRSPFYTNYMFLANILVLLVITLYISIYPFTWLCNLLELVTFPSLWINGILLTLVIGNFLVCSLVEIAFDNLELRNRLSKLRMAMFSLRTRGLLQQQSTAASLLHQTEYERVKEELKVGGATLWPPLIKSVSVHDLRADIFTDQCTSGSNSNGIGGRQRLDDCTNSKKLGMGYDDVGGINSRSSASTPAIMSSIHEPEPTINDDIEEEDSTVEFV